jgi:hypothetical protein
VGVGGTGGHLTKDEEEEEMFEGFDQREKRSEAGLTLFFA